MTTNTRPKLLTLGSIAALSALALSGCAAEAKLDASRAESAASASAPATANGGEQKRADDAPDQATIPATPEATPPTDTPQSDTPAQSGVGAAGTENPGFDQVKLDDLLRQAAWANDLDAADRLIAWGGDVNAKDETQQSPYLIATSEGHLEFLRLTLTHGGDVEDLDSWVGTGLIRAAERGHWDIVGELIQAGVPLDHVNRVGYQAIHEDVWMGRDDATYHATTRVLFAGGASFGTPSVNEGLTPLQMAEQRGFTGQVTLIRGLLAEPVPADPTAALLAAAEIGSPNGAAAALRAGADGTAQNAVGLTAFELATAGNHVLTAQVLTALGYA